MADENEVMMRQSLNWYKNVTYTGIKNTMKSANPRRMLGIFIRAHRERLPLPPQASGRRRTPGWRREELAAAAGVGVTWITWLEQGRDVSASPQALARLALALRLNEAERASLFDLAGRRDPVEVVPPDTSVAPQVLALPELFQVPAYLLDHQWSACSWNTAAQALFVGWLDQPHTDKNLLRYVFFSPTARTLIGDWSERAQRLVAEFRADFNRRPRDAALLRLIDELTQHSPVFAQHWEAQSVLGREGGRRSFQVQGKGLLHYEQSTLLPASFQAFKLVCLVPVAQTV